MAGQKARVSIGKHDGHLRTGSLWSALGSNVRFSHKEKAVLQWVLLVVGRRAFESLYLSLTAFQP